MESIRVGLGYDIHRLTEGRRLMIGGVEIPAEIGEDAHSDGDVLVHAVIDALLGGAGLGDIGSHFPPDDSAYKDISSRTLLRKTGNLLKGKRFRIMNLDCTVILESPRLLPFRDRIKDAIAADLEINNEAVSVKGKTKEGLDKTGEGRAVEAYAVALLSRMNYGVRF